MHPAEMGKFRTTSVDFRGSNRNDDKWDFEQSGFSDAIFEVLCVAMQSRKEIHDWPSWPYKTGDVLKWLPETYRNELPEEGARLLADIRRGLSLAVCTSDVDGAGAHWAKMLGRCVSHNESGF